MSPSSNSEKLSFREKVSYGLGDMASNFYMGFFGLFLLYYYTDVFGLSPAAAATMLLVTKIVDAISDPAMGLIADRTHSRWGKYRPYLLWMAIPYAIMGCLLFFGPELSQLGKLIYAYVTYTLVMLAYTAINVPYSALLAVISPRSEERTKATQYRFIFASLGTLSVGALATPLVSWLGDGDQVLGFRLTILLFALLSVLCFWITFYFTHEWVQLPPHKSPVLNDFSSLLSNRSWLVLGLTSLLVAIGLNARFASIIFYLRYYLQTDDTAVFLIFDKTAILISCGLIGQLIGALVTPKLLNYFEKHHLMIIMNFLHAGLLLLSYVMPQSSYALIVFVHSLGIFTFGVVITLLFAMYTDCSHYGEWQTGNQAAGLTFSASMFTLKLGNAIGSALPGYILAIFGFVANEVQTATSLTGIKLMFNLTPAIFFFMAGIMMFLYHLNRSTLEQVEKELLERHASNSV
jgi:GPH family glycoside/pentoside/hexuronide:cation symporter